MIDRAYSRGIEFGSECMSSIADAAYHSPAVSQSSYGKDSSLYYKELL
jgi:hypothetical protein